MAWCNDPWGLQSLHLFPSNFEAALKDENPPFTSSIDVWKKQRRKELEAKIGYGRFTRSLLSGSQAAYATADQGQGRELEKHQPMALQHVRGYMEKKVASCCSMAKGFFFTSATDSRRFSVECCQSLSKQQSCQTLINCMVGLIRKSKLRGKQCQSASLQETFHRILVAGFKDRCQPSLALFLFHCYIQVALHLVRSVQKHL